MSHSHTFSLRTRKALHSAVGVPMAIVIALTAACTPKTAPTQQLLPTPVSSEEAALIDLRPLTMVR